MATDLKVIAVGTDSGRPVVFLEGPAIPGSGDPKAVDVIVPTDTTTMAKLAGMGVPLRNVNEVAVRRRRM